MLNPYQFHSQPQQLMGYAESAKKIPSIAWEAAETNAKKRELEHLWVKEPEYAYLYAYHVIDKRWPPGEAAIASNPVLAYVYAYHVIKGPWPPGEAAIAKDPEWAYQYARDVIGKRWPPGEAAIASDPEYAYGYAQYVIKKPWPPGEAAIASSDYAKEYQDFKERRSR
jgi:hypothetical protein